ncbi:hypothetical protein [Psychroserpens algicola]|uniref:Uncharacterized protein n=1 Tax=Psychroserpens algicola TaxID=1719034 RepID=A0ABT0HCP6_9FLAO|nr:hypothetical protein [Psychroserpens algicola]MCK8481962.1 hypothetical protein [Psychroserpens algicola]
MKSTKLLTILMLCGSLFAFSQDLIQTQTLVESGSGQIYTFDRSDKTIQGTPYIIDEFTPARVTADTEKIYNLRYNAITDQMEVQTEKNTIQAINKNIDGVKITFLKDEKTYQSANYINEDGIAERGYFIFVNNVNAKVNLLIKESKKFIERRPAKSSYQDTKPAHFKRVDDVFYIMLKNNTAQILPEKKKDMIKLFPEHSDKIEDFIKSNKIKTSKKEDLLELINFVNTL